MNCLLCTHHTEPWEFEKKYHYCTRCDYVSLDPTYRVSSSDEKKRYDLHDNSESNSGYRAYLEEFLNLAGVVDGESRSALDFGCGPGPVLGELLRERGYRVDLYDPYFYPREDFKNSKYDLITCTEVIEHVYDPRKTLELLFSLLKPAGKLVIRTNFHQAQKDHFEKWWYRRDETHVGFFSQKTFAWIAAEFGGEIEFCDGRDVVVIIPMQS